MAPREGVKPEEALFWIDLTLPVPPSPTRTSLNVGVSAAIVKID